MAEILGKPAGVASNLHSNSWRFPRNPRRPGRKNAVKTMFMVRRALKSFLASEYFPTKRRSLLVSYPLQGTGIAGNALEGSMKVLLRQRA